MALTAGNRRWLSHMCDRWKWGGRPVGGFVLIDLDGFSTDAALTAWVKRGLDFVGTLPAKRPRKEVRDDLPDRSQD